MIHPFTINNTAYLPWPIEGDYLLKDTQGYFSYNYFGYEQPGNPDFINTLKNQFDSYKVSKINSAINELRAVLDSSLPEIKKKIKLSHITICCIPRASAELEYSPDQLHFRETISDWINTHKDMGFIDGTRYIRRHTTTKTTHMRNTSYFQDGDSPYPGITKKTCNISPNVSGSNILLIDDIYTKNVFIDEDAIQALYDNGAKSVTFYAVAYTDRIGKFPYSAEKEDDDFDFLF